MHRAPIMIEAARLAESPLAAAGNSLARCVRGRQNRRDVRGHPVPRPPLRARPSMQVERTEIPDVIVITPKVFRDDRGFFLETYQAERYAQAGISGPFVQDNHSRSVRGTLRGLHAQRQYPQGKLVRCIAGEIWDVAVDIRRGSPTFGRWVGLSLPAEHLRQIWGPPRLA